MNNQAKVGLAAAACLVCQGYAFSFILKVEPHLLVTIAPLFPLIAYIYAKNRRAWSYDKPSYWIAAIALVTLIDLAPYAWAASILQ